jgi:isopenicillin N synthase-like dioxygenase
MERIIGIANQKGGVGKTTTAINLAACLGAAEKRILLIDLDPQGNSTSGIGIDRTACQHSVYDTLVGTLSVQEAIVPAVVESDPYYTSEVGRKHFLPHIWPTVPPDFQRAAIVYYQTMSHLIIFLMRLTALALGLEETGFDGKVDRSIGTMRLNYYPAQAEPPRPGQLRAGAHTDYGGFTILSGEDVPGGPQVRTRTGNWIDVRTEPNSFVVNIGDLLMRWTNDRWLSNLHRVVNPPWTP